MLAQTTVLLAAAGDYADNDVMSQDAGAGLGAAWEFTVSDYNDGEGFIEYATISSPIDAQTFTAELFLFKANPSASELDDNSAVTLHNTDRKNLLGSILFPAMADVGGFAFATWTPPTTTGCIPFKCASATKKIYGILVARDAITNETAGQELTITLHCSDMR